MGIDMEELPAQMSLSALAERCISEINNYRHGETYNDEYCLEIFHRAMLQGDEDAWSLLKQRFTPILQSWIRRHQQRDLACRHESEENYVDMAFARFWQATVRNQELKFDTLAAALRYLQASLNGAILDTLRAYSRSREVPLLEPGSGYEYAEEPAAEDEYSAHELWDIIKNVLPNPREQRLAFLLYHEGLKPREIVHFCPQEFSNVKEVYRLSRNVFERLLRNRDQIRWRLSDEAF